MTFSFYLDMDGVLADFDAGVTALGFTRTYNARSATLTDAQKHEKKAMYTEIGSTPRFFANLPKMSRADELWTLCAPYGISVLTGIPKFPHMPELHSMKARQEKLQFVVDKFLIPSRFAFFGCRSAEKPTYKGIVNPHFLQVLIDDRRDNCEEWEAAGGIAIHYPEPDFGILAVNALINQYTDQKAA